MKDHQACLFQVATLRVRLRKRARSACDASKALGADGDVAKHSSFAELLARLEMLLTSPGKIFSRERTLDNVWDMSGGPLTDIVNVYIGRLRKLLRAGAGTVSIETLRGLRGEQTRPWAQAGANHRT